MRLVVHIGATKAAAEQIQAWLGANLEVLDRHGIRVPSAGRLASSAGLVAHHHLVWQLLEDTNFRADRGGWAELQSELSRLNGDAVLLSSEGFAHLATDPSLRATLAEQLRALSDDVTLVYVAREPLALLNDMFVHAVQNFAEPRAFHEYVGQVVRSGHLNLEESFRHWYESDAFTFRAVPLTPSAAENPLGTLLETAGLDVPSHELGMPAAPAAPEPGPIAIEAMRLVNTHLRVVDGAFSRRSGVLTNLKQAAHRRAIRLGWYGEPYWGWTPSQAEWAIARLNPPCEAFAKAVWGGSWPFVSPTSHEQQALALIDADRKVNKDVLTYLTVLLRRYLKQSAMQVAKSAESGGHADDVVDESTMATDEVERAVKPQGKRAVGRASA